MSLRGNDKKLVGAEINGSATMFWKLLDKLFGSAKPTSCRKPMYVKLTLETL